MKHFDQEMEIPKYDNTKEAVKHKKLIAKAICATKLSKEANKAKKNSASFTRLL